MGKKTARARRARFAVVFGVVASLILSALAPVVAGAADALTPQTAIAHADTLVGHTGVQQQLTLSVPLKVKDAAALDSFIKDLYDPSSPNYQHYLTAAQFTSRFVDSTNRKTVVDYLKGKGLTVNDPGVGSAVSATGSVATVQSAFNVTINDYKTASGRVYYANDLTPAIATNVAALIQGIIGLDNKEQAQPHFIPSKPRAADAKAEPQTPSGCTGAVNAANGYGAFTPNQFGTAYNLDNIYAHGYHGEGQTGAVFELDNYADANVSTFASCFPGTTVPVSRVNVDGGHPSLGSGQIEVELDIDIWLGLAPKLASLLVYESPNTFASLVNQYQRIANDNSAKVISSSWGICEAYDSASTVAAENTIFQQMATQGQTLFAAAGDDGSEDCRDGVTVSVDDPAAQPYVTGVGGTTLTINSANAYSAEEVWNEYAVGGGAGGGGISVNWAKPFWQTGPGTSNSYSNGKRQVPDVSADADPYTGYVVYTQTGGSGYSCSGSNCWTAVGGTSAASPLWGAATSLMNQNLAAVGKAAIGFMNPNVYRILTSQPSVLHDITVGDNCYGNTTSICGSQDSGSGKYPTTAAYDQASGVGSANFGSLIAVMSGLRPSSTPQTVGVFRPSNGLIYLKKTNSTGNADTAFFYGTAGDQPVAGNFTGAQSADSVGIYRPSEGRWYLRTTPCTAAPCNATTTIYFGNPADPGRAVVGDWVGDGITRLGIYNHGQFILRMNPISDPTTNPTTVTYYLGDPTKGDVPIAGDWTNKGFASGGVFRTTTGQILLRNTNTTGPADINIYYGQNGDIPVVGDWDGNGTATFGVARGNAGNNSNQILLRNSNTTGPNDIPAFYLGVNGDIPIGGRWGLP